MQGAINIVSHCYAMKLPQYAAILRYQITSLVRHRCEKPVTFTLCYNADDEATVKVWNWGRVALANAGVKPVGRELPLALLGRRCIGRNIVAKESDEEIVWFTDVDHLFGEGLLNSLWSQWCSFEKRPAMVWPEEVLISQDHETGDACWNRALACEGLAPTLELSEFTVHEYDRATGANQIASGVLMRKHGYLDDDKVHQAPWTDLDNILSNNRADVAFRAAMKKLGPVLSIQLPNYYRIRHTENALTVRDAAAAKSIRRA